MKNAIKMNSLRARYIYSATLIGLFILVTTWLNQQSLSDTARENSENLKKRNNIILHSRLVRNAAWRSEYALFAYLQTPTPETKAAIYQNLSAAIEFTHAIQEAPWPNKNHDDQDAQLLIEALTKLVTHIDELTQIRMHGERLFPALQIMKGEMVHANASFVSYAKLALQETDESFAYHADAPLYELRKSLEEARYTWMMMISAFRIYTTSRLGTFGDPEQNRLAQAQNVEMLHAQVMQKIEHLYDPKFAPWLGIQGEQSRQNMQRLAKQWLQAYYAVKEINESDTWRIDVPYVRTYVQPLLSSVRDRLSDIDQKIAYSAEYDLAAIDKTAAFVSYSQIFMTCVLLGFILLGFYLFERIVLRPIAQVAQGLQETSLNNTLPNLPQVNTHETQMLVEAFINMHGQVQKRQEELEYQALHDTLTSLPNRNLLQDRVKLAINTMQREQGNLALIVLDLNHFKEINDTLGHHFGDKVLIEISARLQALLRKSDTVARLGGDEFAILLPKTSQYQIKYVAEKITESIEQQIQLGAHKFYVSSSLGIAMYPNDGEDYQTLIQRADVAMYISKRSSLNFAFYEQSQDTHSVEKLALISDLHKAIESDELELFYQPKLDLVAQSASSAEALLRWRHPERGFISPEEIIEIAERTGIIKPLTCFVINKALQQSAQWSSVGIEVIISVNLSVWNLQDRSFIGQVQQALQKWQVDCEKVTFEITESAMMADPERALATLCALDDMGIGLSIDDFGTGFSSLSYLKKLPVDELKIDKSFVMNMIEDKDDATIVHSTIELAHNLHLKVVAEGVETQQILTRLTELGCDWIQGYYLSRPMPVADFTQWYLSEAPQNKDTPKQDASRESV